MQGRGVHRVGALTGKDANFLGRALVVGLLTVVGLGGAGPAAALASSSYPPPSVSVPAPDTMGCDQQLSPPPAVDSSEVIAPGQTAPTPLPVPAEPVGGSAMGSCDFVLPGGSPELPIDISAHAWMVADLTTGQVLGGKDVHGRYRPASTLKLLSMLALWPNLPLGATVTGTEEDAAQEGSKVGVGDGGVYTVRELMLGLILNSGNDAAYALARANGGFAKTVAEMNATAASIGATDTRAATVSGLDGPGQQTSAYDLALIMRADLALPGFGELISTETATFPGYGAHPSFGIANENKLLGNYPGALGGKTGFTTDAGNTYVGVAERNGHTLVVTMLAGSQHPRRQWMQAASLLDWGFAVADAGLDPVGRLVDPAADLVAASSAAAVSSNSAVAAQDLGGSSAGGSSAGAASSGGSSAGASGAGGPSAGGSSAETVRSNSSAAAPDTSGGIPWEVWLIVVGAGAAGTVQVIRRVRSGDSSQR